ncbi:MAG: class D sortase [Janthinobacterium lividum]
MARLLSCTEFALWTAGLLCMGTLLAREVEGAAARETASDMNTGGATSGLTAPVRFPQLLGVSEKAAHHLVRPEQVLGSMEIPALGLRTPIVDDDDMNSLLLGAGHIRGTAMPGGLGNFVVAAHRDTYFRPLQNIKAGMKIRVVTADNTFIYIVDSMKIVEPKDVQVLDMGDVPQMTLITCYPFQYIGAAPKRFTVQAHLVSF